jgi:hypothetical protein
VNRRTINSGNRTNTGNTQTVNNITNQSTTVNNTNTSNNRTNYVTNNRTNYVASNQTNVAYRSGGRWGGWGSGRVASWGSYGTWGSEDAWHGYYPHLHSSWYSGGWTFGSYRRAAWFVPGRVFGWLLSTGQTVAYNNPYYVPPTTEVEFTALDYSQPIAVPDAPQDPAPSPVPVDVNGNGRAEDQGGEPPRPGEDSSSGTTQADNAEKQEEAKRFFEQGRKAFKRGDYTEAQELAEKALKELPGDPALHEFRALTLFSQENYRDAAATVYSVLAAGPGWNWETLKSLYPDTKTYTKQLRTLERYQREHPRSAEASFLLAYHYLTLGAKEAAIKKLEQTVKLNSKDQLSAQLLKMLKKPPEESDERPTPRE